MLTVKLPSFRTHIAVLMAATALAGCAPRIQLPAPTIGLPPSFETTAPAAGQASITVDRWWDSFGDPQLAELISTALDRSTTARLAYARIAEARALRSQSRAGTLPSGNLSGTATGQGSEHLWGTGATSPGLDSYRMTVSPSWEVDLFGRLAAIRSRADMDFAASALDFYGVRLTLAADVAASLFQARSLAVQYADAGESLRIARELATSATLGLSRALTAGTDMARLRADVASSEAEVTRLAAELRIAKRSLLILVGNPTATTDSLPIEPTLAPPPSLPPITPGLLLARRPDIRSAEVALQVAAKTIKIDQLALFPRFDLQPAISLSATGGAGGGGAGLWSLAAGVALPILDRARLLAQLRISEARGQQAVIQYEQSVQRAFGEAENALTSVAADEQRVEQLGRATTDARTAFDATRRGYIAGLTDLTTLLQTERTWRQNRAALTRAQANHLADTVAAFRAIGGGWSPDASLTVVPPPTLVSGNR